MTRLLFEDAAPVVASSPNRMDVACFVGFVRRRSGPLPADARRWLAERGWLEGPHARASAGALGDVPVPIEGWDAFDRLFAWERRPVDRTGARVDSYLGAAVRSFFAQGGRRCYVVRVGDPWALNSRRDARLRRIAALLPGVKLVAGAAGASGSLEGSAMDPRTWKGIGHLRGLPDVSLLCLPDLADLVAADPPPKARAVKPRPAEEHFVECSMGDDASAGANGDELARLYHAPRADAASYRHWAAVVHQVARFLAGEQRQAQLVAAVPIPRAGTREEVALDELLLDRYLAARPAGTDTGLASSFVQLAYPWPRTAGSAGLPERLESPDAVLAGVLARNALTRGAFRTAAGLHLADVQDVFPPLRDDQLAILPPSTDGARPPRRTLVERVSVLGPTPSGLRVISDVTASLDETYRPASVHRLISVVVRAARELGETLTFESSGEALWAQLRARLETLLFGLFQAGGLRGERASDAYQVRCDRTTMTQQDIDSGRLVAEVQLVAAAPIELVRVTLVMADGGTVTLAGAPGAQEAA